VNINAGTLTLGNALAIGSTNAVAFGASSNGKLQLNNNSITITGLTGDSTAIVENGGSTADSTLTVNLATGSNIFGGVLRDGGGDTVSSGATLQVGDGVTNGTIGSIVDNGAVNFNANGSLPYSGTISGSGTVTVATGTVVLTGGFNNAGTTTISSGATLQV